MLLTVVLMLSVLGLLVIVHEFGHFIAARLTGVKVEAFSIGFGKKLLKKEMMGTEFSISLIPLGGYVKLAGETEYETEQHKPYYFQAKNRLQRFFVLFMGPFFNLLLALFILTFIFVFGKEVDKFKTQEPIIGYVITDSAADKAGIKDGDQILKVGRRIITNWEELQMAIGANPNIEMPVEYKRGGQILTTNILPDVDKETGIGFAGWIWGISPKIATIQKGFPAEYSGLAVGDIILEVNNKKIHHFKLSKSISRNMGKEIKIKVQREDQFFKYNIIPKKTKDGYKIGIETQPYIETVIEKYGIFKAFYKAVNRMGKIIGETFEAIKKMLIGKLSPKSLSGPIAIAKYTKQTFISGFSNFLIFIAFISLQLGIINLFPIPVLDGGNLMILALEGIFRRDFNVKFKNFLMYLGFTILLALMSFAILNDIAKELPNGWNSFIPFK